MMIRNTTAKKTINMRFWIILQKKKKRNKTKIKQGKEVSFCKTMAHPTGKEKMG